MTAGLGKNFFVYLTCSAPRGVLYVGSVNGLMTAFQTQKQVKGKAEAGEILWQYRLPVGHVLSSPITLLDRVVIGSMSGLLVGFPLVAPSQTDELSAPLVR